MSMYTDAKTVKWSVPTQEVDQRGIGERLCKQVVKHVNWTGMML